MPEYPPRRLTSPLDPALPREQDSILSTVDVKGHHEAGDGPCRSPPRAPAGRANLFAGQAVAADRRICPGTAADRRDDRTTAERLAYPGAGGVEPACRRRAGGDEGRRLPGRHANR